MSGEDFDEVFRFLEDNPRNLTFIFEEMHPNNERQLVVLKNLEEVLRIFLRVYSAWLPSTGRLPVGFQELSLDSSLIGAS
jgi:lauroyl/myristoyl acyltransferase